MNNHNAPTDWLRHWDTLCMGTVTIATATLGAVILVAGLSSQTGAEPNNITTPPGTLRVISTAAAGASYMILVPIAGTAMFIARGDEGLHANLKRTLTLISYLFFAMEAFALSALLAIYLFGNVTVTYHTEEKSQEIREAGPAQESPTTEPTPDPHIQKPPQTSRSAHAPRTAREAEGLRRPILRESRTGAAKRAGFRNNPKQRITAASAGEPLGSRTL